MRKKMSVYALVLCMACVLCACGGEDVALAGTSSEPYVRSSSSTSTSDYVSAVVQEKIDPSIVDDDPSHFIIKNGVLIKYTGPGGYVIVPNGIVEIGDTAFQMCLGLTGVELPETLTSIGLAAFRNCQQLTSITIPDSVTFIGESVFDCCMGLENITIGKNVTHIGAFAFEGCSLLTEIFIPKSVDTIGHSLLSQAHSMKNIVVESGNQNYISEDGVLFTKDMTELVCFPAGRTGEYSIPQGVINIGREAFNGSRLNSVTLPEGLLSIGQDAFACCNSLTSIIVPDGVTSIGSGAFNGENLTSVRIPASVVDIDTFTFTNNITDLYYGGSQAEWDTLSEKAYLYVDSFAVIHYNS